MSVCTCIAQDRVHALYMQVLAGLLSSQPIVLWNSGCCSEHHFEESTTLRSRPFARYGRQFIWRQPGRRQLLDKGSARTITATWVVRIQILDTGIAAQARLRHREKNDWQPNNFSIFLSLLLLHIIHVPLHIHNLTYCIRHILLRTPSITYLSNS